jgi:hypothetical protein
MLQLHSQDFFSEFSKCDGGRKGRRMIPRINRGHITSILDVSKQQNRKDLCKSLYICVHVCTLKLVPTTD